MMISFKPYGYSKGDMVSAIEAMGYPYFFSGLKRRELEDFFCQKLDREYSLAVNDLTNTLLILLDYIGLSKHSKIVLSPLSYFKHFSPYLRISGYEYVYADVERWYLNLDVKRLTQMLTDDVKVLIVNNVLGIPANWDAIVEMVKDKDILLIEDSRETIFTEYKGKPAGAFGYVSLLGFSDSSIITGHGGIILTDDKLIYERLREYVEPMDDITSALILSQIKHIDEKRRIREELVNLYSQLLVGIEGLKAQFCPNYVSKMHWSYFCIHLGKRYSQEARMLIKDLLIHDGIEVREYPIPQDMKEGKKLNHLHIAHEVGPRILLLPLHEDITEEDVYFVCERLKEHVVQIGAGSVDH